MPDTCCSKKIKPLENRVLIERIEATTMTKGGILLPNQEKPRQGKVLAVGPGKIDEKGHTIPMNAQVGNLVLFAPYTGVELELEGTEYLILSEDDILAVLS